MAERPTAAIVLSVVGGILGLVAGIAATGGWLLEGMVNNVVYGGYWIVVSIITIIGVLMIYVSPSSTRKWSIVIIISSIASGVNILALIGGILANRWKQSINLLLKISLILGVIIFLLALSARLYGVIFLKTPATFGNTLDVLWFASLLGFFTLVLFFIFAWLILHTFLKRQ